MLRSPGEIHEILNKASTDLAGNSPATLHLLYLFPLMRTAALAVVLATVSGFHPSLPRLNSRDARTALGRMPGEHFVAVLDDHTHIKMRKFKSSRFVMPGTVVPCLSLSNIEVSPQQRRRGHARRALLSLRTAASANQHLLIVENVVSDHMHSLIQSLDGAPLPGCRPGAKGCNYMLPPKKDFQVQDFAQEG